MALSNIGHGALIAATLCALAGGAQGQITIVNSTGLARATAGDGSGNSQQTSTNTSLFTLNASKNFINGGHVDAHNQWSFTNFEFTGSFSAHSFAASQFEAGWAETTTLINFNTSEALDVEYQGGYSVNSPSGNASIEMRNRITNGYVAGGFSPNLVHIPAGQYKLAVDSYLPYGDLGGDFTYSFHPGNDRCQYATEIDNGIFLGSTTYATADGQATCGTSTSSPAVWFKYVSPAMGPLTITTCGSSYDTVLSVYHTASCPSGTGSQVACNDDAPVGSVCGGTRSVVNFQAITGDTYYIRVSGYNGASGNYVLNVGPTNDHCSDAMVVGEGSFPFDTTFADTDGPTMATCNFGGQDNQVNGDLWYSFTPTEDGTLDVTTCGSSFDTKLAIYQNPPCGPRSVYRACSDDGCSLQSAINGLDVIGGVEYSIRVGGFQTARGAGVLNINFAPNCPADYNNDGGVDGDDVIAFFGDWDASNINADFNGDGGVDGDDVILFFQHWDSGC